MDCKKVSEHIIDFIDNNLQKQMLEEIQAHLDSCPLCKNEFKESSALLKDINKSESQIPDLKLKQAFHTALAVEKNKSTQAEKPIRRLIHSKYRLFWQIAAGIILLIGGYILGYNVKNDGPIDEGNTAKLIKMQNDVSEMKEMMALNLLKDESASQRIKAVNYTEEISNPDNRVIEALIETLNSDKSTNVRLAAVYSLARFKTNNLVKYAFVNALNRQDDPMIQIVIINQLVEMEEVKAVDELKILLKNKDLHNEVRTQAAIGVKALS